MLKKKGARGAKQVLKLLLGRAGSGKTAAILKGFAAGGAARQQVLLVPEQHSHDMERRLCAEGDNRTSRYGEVLSFTRLANRVFAACGGLSAKVLDAGGRVLVMRLAVKSVAEKLRVYARPSRKSAFLSGLIATVDELKSCRVSARQLWDAGEETGGSEGDKLRDLALIYGAYEALTDRQGADPRDTLRRLDEALERCPWAEGKDVWIDCFTDFTAQELQVIGRLLRQAHQVTVALTCDGLDAGGEEGVFAAARHTARRLLRLAQEVGSAREVQVLAPPAAGRAAELLALEAQLSGPSEEPWDAPAPGVCFFEAESPYSEVEWAAAEILRLTREEGLRFRDIAVTARSMDCYGELIETVFPRYGIALFRAGMSDVLQKPVFSLVLSALEAAAGDYAYEDLFRYLKNSLAPISDEERDLLENYAIRWNLRGKRWRQSQAWSMHPQGYALAWREEDRALLARLDALRRRVIAPLETLRGTGYATGREQAVSLYRFLEEIDLRRRLAERSVALRERGEAELAEEYRQLWDILMGGLEQCAQVLEEVPMEQEEFVRLLALVLSQYDVGTIPVALDQVTVGEMPRLAHKHAKAVFLLGADEGAIPQTAPSPGLLNDDDRSLLASYGLETAPVLTEKLCREDTIFYETCALPGLHLSVSWAGQDAEGKEQRAAEAVTRLRRLLPQAAVLRERELDGLFRLCAPAPALELAGRSLEAAAALCTAAPEYRRRVERMRERAALGRGHLTARAVEELYGRRVPMSASRMDKYRSCHFAYFMQYGLKAQARRSAAFQAPEYGTFVHYVLEHVLREWQPGQSGEQVPGRELVEAVIGRYVKEELGGLEQETPRFRYLFARLVKSVCAVVDNVAQELAASDFKPISFELGFGRSGELPPVEFSAGDLTVSLSGFVDRVDGWEHGGRLYLRVVDYKTGRKSFDFTDVWNGLGLQMLLYLFTLQREGRALYGKEIVPAGVLYLPAREAVVSGSRDMSEAQRRKKVDEALRRKGLVLDEPQVLAAMEHIGEEGVRFLPVRLSPRSGALTGEALVSAERLGRLEGHIARLLRQVGAELAAGNIAADPYWKGPESNACRNCDYVRACHFEEGAGGDCRRWISKVGAGEFWRRLGEDGTERQPEEGGQENGL